MLRSDVATGGTILFGGQRTHYNWFGYDRRLRKIEREKRSAPRSLPDKNGSMQSLHDLIDDSEAQSGTTTVSIATPEAFKDFLALLERNTRAAIHDFN